MQFNSFAEFLAMGHHGPYVWSAFISGIILLATNVWWASHKYRKVKRELAQQYRRQSLQESK